MEWLKATFYLDDAVEGINKPTDVSHYKTLRFHLNVLNFWPNKELGENVSKYRIILAIVYSVVFLNVSIGSVLYILSRDLTFYELGHTYITDLLCFITVARLVMAGIKGSCKFLFSTFLKEIHLFYYKDKSEYAMQTYREVHKISHFFTMALVTETLTGIVLFNLQPIYRNYSKGLFKHKILYNATYEHQLYYACPLDIYTSFNAYLVAIPFNYCLSYMCSTSYVMLDLLLTTMVFHLWGHLKILNHMLESFPLPKREAVITINNENYVMNDMYSDEELEEVANRLKECILYHRFIINFANKVSKTFGPMLFVYYMLHQAIGCLLLLLCSQMTTDALMTYGPLTLIANQLIIQLSVIFELIGTASEKLKDSVYCVPWEYMDTSNRKTVLIFLMRVQEPIHVKALGLADVGVRSMAAIMKTSLSYFMFLRTV